MQATVANDVEVPARCANRRGSRLMLSVQKKSVDDIHNRAARMFGTGSRTKTNVHELKGDGKLHAHPASRCALRRISRPSGAKIAFKAASREKIVALERGRSVAG